MAEQNRYSLPAGTVLNGKWVILEFIAKGGMGEIYRAHQLNLKRDVAIKIVSKEWLQDIEGDEEELENAFRRFRQEVLTMAQLRHTNVIQIYDFDKATVRIDGDDVELEYIALEYVPGRTLRDTMRQEGFYPEEDNMASWLENTFLPVMDGVAAIHATGILHRDIKPANVLMDGSIPKIADFGLARSCKLESMTCSLEVKGSPAYMAPEQFIDFKGTDERTDIYSLGKILYEAADGKIPKKAIPFRQARLKETESPFYEQIDQIIRRATDENPANRFQSVQEMKEAVKKALERFHNQKPSGDEKAHGIHLSKRTLTFAVAAGVLLAGLLSFWAWHSLQEHFLGSNRASGTGINAHTPSSEKYFYPEGVPAEISAPDGATLKLIPGGILAPSNGIPAETPVSINPFYMDETPVTNQQFVDFLNSISSELKVQEAAVRRNGQIYLYLGEAVQGYEPIIYQDGLFRIKHSGHSACPVVRVTGYGAEAYAEFYGRRLPTAWEWLFAASAGTTSENPSLFGPVKFPIPVMMLPSNSFGIKGLNIHLGCWVTYVNKGDDRGLAVLGGGEAGGGSSEMLPAPVVRRAWEAFEEVGFRCARDI